MSQGIVTCINLHALPSYGAGVAASKNLQLFMERVSTIARETLEKDSFVRWETREFLKVPRRPRIKIQVAPVAVGSDQDIQSGFIFLDFAFRGTESVTPGILVDEFRVEQSFPQWPATEEWAVRLQKILNWARLLQDRNKGYRFWLWGKGEWLALGHSEFENRLRAGKPAKDWFSAYRVPWGFDLSQMLQGDPENSGQAAEDYATTLAQELVEEIRWYDCYLKQT